MEQRLIDATAFDYNLLSSLARDVLFQNKKKYTIGEIINMVDKCHTINERSTGHWIHTEDAHRWHEKERCSECGYHEPDFRDLTDWNYCPNCGVKMVKE